MCQWRHEITVIMYVDKSQCWQSCVYMGTCPGAIAISAAIGMRAGCSLRAGLAYARKCTCFPPRLSSAPLHPRLHSAASRSASFPVLSLYWLWLLWLLLDGDALPGSKRYAVAHVAVCGRVGIAPRRVAKPGDMVPHLLPARSPPALVRRCKVAVDAVRNGKIVPGAAPCGCEGHGTG